MNKEWYKSWFGNEYLTVYSHRDDEEARQVIDLVRRHIDLKDDFKILDLCCGQGRHAVLLAALGYQVFGLDLSRTLLEIAKFRCHKTRTASFIQADMRALPASHRFDLLLNLFTSFGYFESDQENREVFCQFRQVLKPGGYFVFDYLNKSNVINHIVPFHREEIENVLVEQERFIEDQSVRKIITLKQEGKQSVFHESVKLYEPEQLLGMMKSCDLQVLQIFGDYNGAQFQTDSERFIVIGQKE